MPTQRRALFRYADAVRAQGIDAPPPPGTHVIVERPEHGLARGQYAWPDWGIATLGGIGVLLGLVAFAIAARRMWRSS